MRAAPPPHTHKRLPSTPSSGKELGLEVQPTTDSALCHPGPGWGVAVPAAGLGVLGYKPLSFQPARDTHSPSRKEPVEREMWSDNRCSRKRGKKLLLKWQWKT